MPAAHKYFAHKVRNAYGVFDSTQEYKYYLRLLDMQHRGHICGLRRATIHFLIIPKQTYIQTVRLKTKTKFVERVDEQAAYYTPDFLYYDNVRGVYVCCEVKSRATKDARDYPLRRKLMKQKITSHNAKGRGRWVFEEVCG